MKITKLNDQHVCILGYGREGKAMHKALETHAPHATVTIRDQQDGEDYLQDLDAFDVIIKSPGIPPHILPTIPDNKLTNSTQIFLDSINQDATVIGITGSKGKSTTASLVHAMLVAAGRNTILIGNIGEPAIAHIDDIDADTVVVMELSSYQLMQITRSPRIAVVTSFFPEHLDYHGSLEDYKEAKKNLTKYQRDGDIAFYPDHDRDAYDIASAGEGKVMPCDEGKWCPIPLEEMHLLGEHNRSNLNLAWAACTVLGISHSDVINVGTSFKPLPHRLQPLGIKDDVQWVDDAISTTPDSTIAAINALSPQVTTIIVGGKDRGIDFMELGRVIDNSSIRTVILLGESGRRIAESITNKSIAIHKASSMEEAVEHAKKSNPNPSPTPNPIVLLSPASPSYDLYENFEEKGDAFANAL